MEVRKIDFADTHSFSSFFLDYIGQKETLTPFYNRFPRIENFKGQLADKASFPQSHRQVLVDQLTRQYASLKITPLVQHNLNSLRDSKTFTITTGHQLNIFTGPLYFIFKIVTVINACKQLKSAYPDYHFVPVYWMASEDHDYEEIKSIRLYGNKYEWKTNQQGAVGRFHTSDFKSLLEQLPGDVSIFREAYQKNKTLSAAVRQYVNALFGEEGLVVVDADDHDLKKELIPIIEDDLLKHSAQKAVEAASEKLHQLGYHTQVNAREINFFYLDQGIRNRIEKTGEEYQVVDSTLKFSMTEVEKMIKEEPEKFSPNVVLRPLYQEMILPNLAYVGGPAELVYWLQLKGVFDHFNVPFPMLVPRNFGMVVDAPTKRKFEKTGLEIKDLFEEKNYLFNHWVSQHAQHELSLGKELEMITQLFQNIRNRATQIDSTLDKFVGAQTQRTLNSLEHIEKKMMRAEKRLHSDKLQQIESLKESLFPQGGLQERTDNFLNFYQNNPAFIKELIQVFDPFDFRFNALIQS